LNCARSSKLDSNDDDLWLIMEFWDIGPEPFFFLF